MSRITYLSKNRRGFYITVLLLTTVFYSQAQKEANNWFFGQRVGITWNDTRDVTVTGLFGTPDIELKGLPTIVPNASSITLATQEGCFSLSDSNGNLLFYSDGIRVWNRNHSLMPNGNSLTGNDSSTQSGIIMPYPENPNKYIAVTLGTSTNTLSYSVIDMTLNSGLGDVETATKNTMFTGYTGNVSEAVTSIRHANGKDLWVAVPAKGTQNMYAWLITKDGVSANPVVSSTSVSLTGNVGYMKFSPDGTHFAWAGGDHNLYMGNFDTATGQFSNIKRLTPSPAECYGSGYVYGLEFSASGKYLYVSTAEGGTLQVWKVDALMAASDPASVPSHILNFPDCPILGASQLAPDGRIYISAYYKTHMYVVDNPEEYDDLRIYQLPTGFLTGNNVHCRIGLPSFAANWFNISLEGDDTFCVATPQTFNVIIEKSSGSDEISHTEWDFGDGSALIKDTNVNGTQTHTHTYEKKGVYTITVRVFKKSDGSEVTGQRQCFNVKVASCLLPVNHNISTMEFY
ncbi:PKD domain-containing protein [Parabacteroides sp. PF5-9]|uniref:PKD domain-containing protein n=1 Tax=Parabacteroides sp. PF5-9 TaxID=1742404 RepID=UPI0024758252|nr:PKD domain-containing protein [Parabacteroides sp. PF5-9]MDH6358702.1 WD40 repeat protein [Parabacteroides sp. PF5-9]